MILGTIAISNSSIVSTFNIYSNSPNDLVVFFKCSVGIYRNVIELEIEFNSKFPLT